MKMTRRRFCSNSALTVAAWSILQSGAEAAARSEITTFTFGGAGGNPFALEYPRSLGVRAGELIDALVLNGVQHGGSGGANPTQAELKADDYWNQVTRDIMTSRVEWRFRRDHRGTKNGYAVLVR
jgi:hypothetical protein